TGPKAGSDLTRRIQEFTYKARPILRRQHGRDLVTAPGRGARATVDSVDALLSGLGRDVRRLAISLRSVARAHGLVRQQGVDPNRHPQLAGWLAECQDALRQNAIPMLFLNGLLKRAAKEDLDRAGQLHLPLPVVALPAA